MLHLVAPTGIIMTYKLIKKFLRKVSNNRRTKRYKNTWTHFLMHIKYSDPERDLSLRLLM